MANYLELFKSLIDDDGNALDPLNERLQAKIICGVEITDRQAVEALRFLEGMALQCRYHWYVERDSLGLRELALHIAAENGTKLRIARWREYRTCAGFVEDK